MSKLLNYLKDKRIYLICNALITIVFLLVYWLYKIDIEILVYALIISLIIIFSMFFIDYRIYLGHIKQIEYFKNNYLVESIYNLEERDYISEKYKHVISKMKSSIAEIEDGFENEFKEQEEFFMMWTHQVKLPISAIKLLIETEDDIDKKMIRSQLNRIDQYTNMIMAYVRLNSESSDFVFEEVNLDNVIKNCIKKFKIEFIHKKIKMEFHPTEQSIISDKKWLEFAIEQILSNSLKYTDEGLISIYYEDNKLYIVDTGCGISEADLPRIFQKGYTGYNGRITNKSSGLGLYLVKSILDKLDHDIIIESKVNHGTKVVIDMARYKLIAE